MSKGEIGILTSGGDHQRVGAHQGQGHAPKELAGHFTFLHPLASRRQLFHLSYSSRVKSTKSLDREGKEHNALETASFCCVLDFPLEGLDKGSTCLC